MIAILAAACNSFVGLTLLVVVALLGGCQQTQFVVPVSDQVPVANLRTGSGQIRLIVTDDRLQRTPTGATLLEEGSTPLGTKWTVETSQPIRAVVERSLAAALEKAGITVVILPEMTTTAWNAQAKDVKERTIFVSLGSVETTLAREGVMAHAWYASVKFDAILMPDSRKTQVNGVGRVSADSWDAPRGSENLKLRGQSIDIAISDTIRECLANGLTQIWD
jgi:hypothetical protein